MIVIASKAKPIRFDTCWIASGIAFAMTNFALTYGSFFAFTMKRLFFFRFIPFYFLRKIHNYSENNK